MAFDVTPTSGYGPYVFTASFANSELIDNVLYSLSFVSSVAVGSCPEHGTSTPSPQAANALLENGVYENPATTSSGSCRAFTLTIRNISSGNVVSTRTLQVSNIE